MRHKLIFMALRRNRIIVRDFLARSFRSLNALVRPPQPPHQENVCVRFVGCGIRCPGAVVLVCLFRLCELATAAVLPEHMWLRLSVSVSVGRVLRSMRE
uniref:Uncharacterized protein n=1 Tax=Physcomitrium patens TaxID=3218 RepID=A0A2K1J8L4_PHYPA|nr:hypothetical protein PHYPA_020977 [Physcomitrium patens]